MSQEVGPVRRSASDQGRRSARTQNWSLLDEEPLTYLHGH
jgi:hypothetical protein